MAWCKNIEMWIEAVAPFADEPPHAEIDGPTTERQLRRLEGKLKKPCPPPLRRFLLEEAGHIFFSWDLRDDIVPLAVRNRPYGGYIEFNLPTMENCDPAEFWTGEYIPTNAEQWQRAWAFAPVPNGDSIALDVATDSENPPVVYLCHEEPENDCRLAESFDEFMEHWTRLGCVGPELWNMRHFLTDAGQPLPPDVDGTPHSYLDPMCPNARTFMQFFGL